MVNVLDFDSTNIFTLFLLVVNRFLSFVNELLSSWKYVY